MSDNDRHVVPHSDGGWDVKAPHAERASSHHDTQADAIVRAREIVANAGGGELITHGMDGRIRESDTVAATRHDMPQAVGEPAVGDGVELPVGASTIDPSEPPSTDDSSAPHAEANEEEAAKPTLGDRVKSLLHRSSD